MATTVAPASPPPSPLTELTIRGNMLGAVLMLLFTAALAWLYSWTVRNAAAAAPHHPDELPPQEAAIR